MNVISNIAVREIRDSRGRPTIEVTVNAGGSMGVFSVPSGASTGSREAYEMRDKDGGMSKAIDGIVSIVAPALVGADVTDQRAIDARLVEIDGTSNKSRLGGNVTIGVSIAAAKSAATVQKLELYQHLQQTADIPPSRHIPYLYLNYINGGKHTRQKSVAFQEHMIVPKSEDIGESIEIARAVQIQLGKIILEQYGEEAASSMGDEGGYVLPETRTDVPFDLLQKAITAAGYEGRVYLAIDAAATSFFEDSNYRVGGLSLNKSELADIYIKLAHQYPLLSIEDPFEENAMDDFAQLQSELDIRIVGDDLTTTDQESIVRASQAQAIRAVIIKPNQIGTLSETIAAMKAARAHGVDCIVSHRSGETMDDAIADIAYAFGAFGIKAGALRRPERIAKYDRLLRISRQ